MADECERKMGMFDESFFAKEVGVRQRVKLNSTQTHI
jgi:hypothetical protein